MARVALRAYRTGDMLPPVGSNILLSGANMDAGSDQDRHYGVFQVIAYTPDGKFGCFQKVGCWPVVERLENCWFANPLAVKIADAREIVRKALVAADNANEAGEQAVLRMAAALQSEASA